MNAAEAYSLTNKRLTNQVREREMLGHVLNYKEDRTAILTELKSEHFNNTNHGDLYEMYQDFFRTGLDITYDAISDHIELRAKNEGHGIELKELLQSISSQSLSDTMPNSIHLLGELLKNRKIYNEILVRGDMMFRNNESTEKIMAHIASVLVSVETGKKDIPIGVVADNVVDSILNPKESERGLLTGLTEFDVTFGGIKKDRYISIAGEPGSGKTAVIIELMARLSERYPNDVAIIFFSMEMSEERVVKRFISRITELSNTTLEGRIKGIDKSQRGKIKDAGVIVSGYPVEIIYKTMNCDQIDLRLKKFALENEGKHLIAILDHIGLVPGQTNDLRINTIRASQTMKSFCRDDKGTSIVLSQLKKEVQSLERRKTYNMPVKSDIMESGQIDQDSDILLLLWRPEMRFAVIAYQGTEEWDTTNKLIILNEKNRDGQSFTHLILSVLIACNKLQNNSQPFN
jgi:replicative DNA helicase